ncbi:hypothetical protein [Zongyangia hominis]|uniref:Uncharacterized protein n=1 Tax=Zongyangia hominis TaxID=2763677 RepID=A0A926ECX6_9FIRM|nr:hypothetical protein [Zongyangia hominis]MBC8570094.1 hypothetical protein [Zongyangia hominis]
MAQDKQQFLTYKGRPLVRSGKTLYYGSMSDESVVMLQILSTKEEEGMDMASRVSVQMISTDTTKSPAERILKKSEQDGLYNALDIASIWLDRLDKQNAAQSE